MEETISLSILGAIALLILSLLFLLLLSFRLNDVDINLFDMEGLVGRKIRYLKDRIEHLEKVLKPK